MGEFGWLTSIEQVLTDRGTQFYANKRDKNGDADSRFEDFLEEDKIKHIKARVKHPQTNENWKNGMILMNSTGSGSIIFTIS